MIYLLKLKVRVKGPGYAENMGHVIRARNERSARRMAANLAIDEGADAWLSDETASCTPLSPDGPAFVALTENGGA